MKERPEISIYRVVFTRIKKMKKKTTNQRGWFMMVDLHLDSAKFVFAVEHSLFGVQPQD